MGNFHVWILAAGMLALLTACGPGDSEPSLENLEANSLPSDRVVDVAPADAVPTPPKPAHDGETSIKPEAVSPEPQPKQDQPQPVPPAPPNPVPVPTPAPEESSQQFFKSYEQMVLARVANMRSFPFNKPIATNTYGTWYPCSYTSYENNSNVSTSLQNMGMLVNCALVPDGTSAYGVRERTLNPQFGAPDDQWFLKALVFLSAIIPNKDGFNLGLPYAPETLTDNSGATYTRSAVKGKILSCGEDWVWRVRVREEISKVIDGKVNKVGLEYVLYFQNDAVDGSDIDTFPDSYALRLIGQEGHFVMLDGAHTRYRTVQCVDGSSLDPALEFSSW